MRSSTRAMLALSAAAMMSGINLVAATTPSRSGNNRRPTPPSTGTALQREIAEWNERVDRERAEKAMAAAAKRLAAAKGAAS